MKNIFTNNNYLFALDKDSYFIIVQQYMQLYNATYNKIPVEYIKISGYYPQSYEQHFRFFFLP